MGLPSSPSRDCLGRYALGPRGRFVGGPSHHGRQDAALALPKRRSGFLLRHVSQTDNAPANDTTLLLLAMLLFGSALEDGEEEAGRAPTGDDDAPSTTKSCCRRWSRRVVVVCGACSQRTKALMLLLRTTSDDTRSSRTKDLFIPPSIVEAIDSLSHSPSVARQKISAAKQVVSLGCVKILWAQHDYLTLFRVNSDYFNDVRTLADARQQGRVSCQQRDAFVASSLFFYSSRVCYFSRQLYCSIPIPCSPWRRPCFYGCHPLPAPASRAAPSWRRPICLRRRPLSNIRSSSWISVARAAGRWRVS